MSKATKLKGSGLNRDAYTDAEIFKEEQKRIFFKNWIFVCHLNEIPNHGDFITFNYNGLPLLITNCFSEIKAYHNICRHKGCILVNEISGNKSRFTCPYHAWVYSLDGHLQSARGLPADISYNSLSLIECSVGISGGFIFICPESPSIHWRDIDDVYNNYFAFYEARNCRTITCEKFSVNANWKIMIENFEECYHCSSIHPEYTSLMAHAMPESTCSPIAQRNLEKYIKEFNKSSKLNLHPFGIMDCNELKVMWAGRFPMKAGIQSQTQDGKLLGPLMGKWEKSDGAISSLRIRPSSYILGPQDYLISITFLPISINKTEVKLTWYLDNVQQITKDKVEELKWFWQLTTKQDNEICERTQAGVESLAYTPGPLSISEDYVESFHNWYLNEMNNDKSI